MFNILPQSAGGTVAVAVEGTLTHEDYDKLIPYLEKAIESAGPIRVFCDMEKFEGMELQAMWDDLKFAFHHMKDIERLAVIGDKTWLEWCIALTGPLVKSEVRYFDPAQRDEAWEWLSGETPAARKSA